MKIFIENSHTSLDYISQLFNILEKSWINLSHDVEEESQDLGRQTQSTSSSAMNKMSGSQPNATHSHSGAHASTKRASGSSPKSSGTHA